MRLLAFAGLAVSASAFGTYTPAQTSEIDGYSGICATPANYDSALAVSSFGTDCDTMFAFYQSAGLDYSTCDETTSVTTDDDEGGTSTWTAAALIRLFGGTCCSDDCVQTQCWGLSIHECSVKCNCPECPHYPFIKH